MKNLLVAFAIGNAVGVMIVYAFYLYNYTNHELLIHAIVEHAWRASILLVSLLLAALFVLCIYLFWLLAFKKYQSIQALEEERERLRERLRQKEQELEERFLQWKKRESLEKEALKRRVQCLKSKIYEIYEKRAMRAQEQGDEKRRRKELMKAKGIIEQCK